MNLEQALQRINDLEKELWVEQLRYAVIRKFFKSESHMFEHFRELGRAGTAEINAGVMANWEIQKKKIYGDI